MDILNILQNEFNINNIQSQNIINLIDEGNTIPFIARYRKELTGSLDDQILRELNDRLIYLRNLKDRKEQIKSSIQEQDKMTKEISLAIDSSTTLSTLEELYRPFKQKRRTRATIAKEKGLEPLALIILDQNIKKSLADVSLEYVSLELGVLTSEEAISGSADIIAEIISDNVGYRDIVRKKTLNSSVLSCSAKDEKAQSVYEMYYNFSEDIKKIAPHRVLAINRGEKENFLKVNLVSDVENILNSLHFLILKNNIYTNELITNTIEDSYKRLIEPSIEREIRHDLLKNAELGAIKIFSANLKMILLQPPIKDKVVIALDPGFRTGCKVAVLDGTGKMLETSVIYITQPNLKISESKKLLKSYINKYNVNLIAIGNGTASRETEAFAAELIKELDKEIFYVIVNEAGASVYSASKLASLEYPNLDVSLRSAISIGRRLQDPLSELVKIDPKSIGVGQYQHDINQKKLSDTLAGVVEFCVNNVGVDLNTASPSLLSYISGITPSIANNILEYRESNGKFKTRKELLKVKKLGPKAFEQCAGFLRISDGSTALDNTGIHPESYKITEGFLKMLNQTIVDVKNTNNITSYINNVDLNQISEQLSVGLPTLLDIVKELEKPGRDPREDIPKQILRSDILDMKDLKENMILQGTVRNVIDFGVFIDIGIHQDGLVHISEISDKFIKHPLEAVSLGDIVTVKVMSINIDKKRVALTMKI